MPLTVEFLLSQAYSTLQVSDITTEFSLSQGLSVEFSLVGGEGVDMETINEGTTADLTMAFKDENGSAITPATATYVLYDKFSGTTIRSGAVSPLSTTVVFSLTMSDNAIRNARNRYEIRSFYVAFTYGAKSGSGEFSYKVENLAKTP